MQYFKRFWHRSIVLIEVEKSFAAVKFYFDFDAAYRRPTDILLRPSIIPSSIGLHANTLFLLLTPMTSVGFFIVCV